MIAQSSLSGMPVGEKPVDHLTRINVELEAALFPMLMTEKSLEMLWTRACQLQCDRPSHWLLLVRLAEAARLCAGNYGDNCEYEATGDFLVNPREILVHRSGGGTPAVKKRYGRLSEQFGTNAVKGLRPVRGVSTEVSLEVTKPPLLPHMTQVLKQSGRVSSSVIHRLEASQRRIADAMAFLAAWRIFDSGDLWRRLNASPQHERVFVESCICRFDLQVFHRIGGDLRRTIDNPDYRSPFLIWPPEPGHTLTGSSSTPALPHARRRRLPAELARKPLGARLPQITRLRHHKP
jgi:hypothetical protein